MANAPLSPLDKVLSEAQPKSMGLPNFQPTERAPAAATEPVDPGQLRGIFESAAIKYNVPVNVLLALGDQESSFNPRAVGPQTKWGQAKGIMQYLDSTAKSLGINAYDPEQSVNAAAMQIRERLDKGHSMEDAIKEHFAGPDRRQWGKKTARYGMEVVAKARGYADLYPDQPEPEQVAQPEQPGAGERLMQTATQDQFQAAQQNLRQQPPSPLTIENQQRAQQPAAPSPLTVENQARVNAGGQPTDTRQYQTFTEATGAALSNVPERFQQSIAGLIQMAGEDMNQERERFIADRARGYGITPGDMKLLAWAGNEGLIDPKTPIPEALKTVKQNIAQSLNEQQLKQLDAAGIINPSEISAFAKDWRAQTQKTMAEVRPEPGSAAYYGSAAIGSLAEMAPMLAAAVATRNPRIASAIMGGQVGGQAYATGRERGLTEDQAQTYALLTAAAEAAPEALVVGRLLQAGAGGIVRKALEGSVLEGSQEAVTAALQAGIDKGFISPDMTLKEALVQVRDGAIVGALVGGGMGATIAGADKALGRGQQPAQQQERIEPTISEDGATPAAEAAPTTPAAQAATTPAATTPQAVAPAPVQAPAPSGPLGRALQNAMQGRAEESAADAKRVTLSAEGLEPISGAIVSETADSVLIRGDDGQSYEITRDELANGQAILQPEGEVAAQEQAAEQPAEEQQAEEPVPMAVDALTEDSINLLREAGVTDEQLAAMTAEEGQIALDRLGASMPTVEVPETEGAAAQDAAPDVAIPAQPAAEKPVEQKPVEPVVNAPKREEPKSYEEMTEPELRDRLKYLGGQAKATGGWNKMLMQERRKVEQAIEAKKVGPTNSLQGEPASWVIRDKSTGEAVMETFDRKKVDALNTEKYEAVPVQQHLGELNQQIKAAAPTNRATATDAGAQAFAAGTERAAPDMKPGLQEAWLKGWDKAKAAAPSVAEAQTPAVQPKQESITGRDIDGDWAKFAKRSGTLNVPRAEMPQIKAEHRGAMTNFLNARGIAHQEETVPAASLKPTQAEFSREKVAKAKAFDGGDRSILVSSDNHVLDGHHQWLAKREAGEDVKIIRLDAPIRDLLKAAHEFPSSTVDEGAAAPAEQKAQRKKPVAKKPRAAAEKSASKPRAKKPQQQEGGEPRYSLSDTAAHPFAGVTREQFLGSPTITKEANAATLQPRVLTTVEPAQSEPFPAGKGLTAKYSPDGAAVFDGDKVIASYNFGDTLVVDRKYRRQGIAAELVYQWRMRNPGAKPARERTKKSQALQEKVWERIQGEINGSRFSLGERQTETPAFKRWFGDSKVVDENGDPLVVYHGTTGDFDAFGFDRVNIESDLGGGFYFSNNRDEVAANYAGEGPDLTNRLEQMRERIDGEIDDDPEAFGVTEEELEEDRDAVIDRIARSRLSDHAGATMPVYLSLQNPVVIGGDSPTTLEIETVEDDDGDIIDEQGSLIEFMEALRDIANEGRYDSFDADQAIADMMENGDAYDGITAERLIEVLKASEGLMYANDMEGNGELASNEILRRAFEAMGFDGFIDNTVNRKFGSERRTGKSMSGMDEGTTHYIAFRPEQVKSAIGNRGTFDPGTADIRFSMARDGDTMIAGDERFSLRQGGMSALMASDPVDLETPAELKGLTLEQQREKVYDDMLGRRGIVVNHPDVGPITSNRAGITKSRSSSNDPAKVATAPLLRELAPDMHYLGAKEADGAKYHYLGARVRLDGKPMTMLVTLRDQGGKTTYYNHTMLNDVQEPANDDYQRPSLRVERMSLSAPATGEQIREALVSGPAGKQLQQLIDAGKIVVHDTMDAVPGKTMAGMMAKTEADGVVHVVAENIDPRNASAVLLHEMFHSGGQALAGTRRWAQLMVRLEQLYKQYERSNGKARDFFNAARGRVDKAKARMDSAGQPMSDLLQVEEFGAYAIEEYERAPGAVRKWVDDLVGAIKDYLFRRFGMQLGKVTPAQLRAMAVAAVRSQAPSAQQDARYSMDADRANTALQKVPTASGAPAFRSDDGVVLYGTWQHDDAEGDLDNRARLPYGHTAHVADGNSVWNFKAFKDGQHVANLTLQLDQQGNIDALHDIKAVTRGQGAGEAVVASILAASRKPLRIIQAIPAAKDFWSKMGANGYFDPYDNTEIDWSSYAANRRGSGQQVQSAGAVRRELPARGQGDAAGQGEAAGAGGLDPLDQESLDYLSNPDLWSVNDGGPRYSLADIPENAPTEKQVDSWFSQKLTDAMSGPDSKGVVSLLAAAPMDRMVEELAAGNAPAQEYLKLNRDMGAYRNKKYREYDGTAKNWLWLNTRNRKAAAAMADIMHEATIAQTDPAASFKSDITKIDTQLAEYQPESEAGKAAIQKIAEDKARKETHKLLKARFEALPKSYQDLYVTVRDSYKDMALELDEILAANLGQALDIGARKAERVFEKDMQAIRDEGLQGDEREEAIRVATARFNSATTKQRWNKRARMTELRQQLESNRLKGPYFPLARFGEYFVTVRDKDSGEVISFNLFRTSREQQKFARQAESAGKVTTGLLSNKDAVRGAVDPRFVTEIEEILAGSDVPDAVKDQVWQRYLETLPELSMRKGFIHRKARKGYSSDALRAFASRMFHGSYQMGRLKYGAQMQEQLELAQETAQNSSSPERDTAVVNELNRRHQFVMNPTGSAFAQRLTSAAFVWQLSMSPAAAIVNTSQTVIIGMPVISAEFGTSMASVGAELTKASRDFITGKGYAEKSSFMTADERLAMQAGYDTGVIDATQTHDLAGVGETGVEYSPVRDVVMGVVGWQFHQAERFNREVTYLSIYRMARKKGQDHQRAVETAARVTYKVHFDYSGANRPRFMQSDFAKVALVFRNYSVNMLFRLFRDVHQTINAKDRRQRTMAIKQLAGITGMMAVSAGVRGTWLYGIGMVLASMLFGDDAEEQFKKGTVELLGPTMAGFVLNGVPGHASGIALSERIGMPDLWFRSPDRQLEGKDEFNYWFMQAAGAFPSLLGNVWTGFDMMFEGHVFRGVETASPKFVKDIMRASRFAYEGATTLRGDKIVDELSTKEIITQALGFTPAVVAEQYERNSALMNAQQRIRDDRATIMKGMIEAAKDGNEAKMEKFRTAIQEFNQANPEVPITFDALTRSAKSRAQYSGRAEGGVALDRRLDRRLRDSIGPAIYK